MVKEQACLHLLIHPPWRRLSEEKVHIQVGLYVSHPGFRIQSERSPEPVLILRVCACVSSLSSQLQLQQNPCV